jgi:hypothetical protein
MGDKKKVSILINKEILEKSHELGINVSQACENYLKQLNNLIETTNNKNTLLSPGSSAEESGLVRSPRFEPGSSAWQADVLDQTRLRPLFMLLGFSKPAFWRLLFSMPI